MRALMTVSSLMKGDGVARHMRYEDVLLEGDDNALLHFAHRKPYVLYRLLANIVGIFMEHPHYLHGILGDPRAWKPEAKRDLALLLPRVIEIDQRRTPGLHVHVRGFSFASPCGGHQEVGTTSEDGLQFRWASRGESAHAGIEVRFVGVSAEAAVGENGFGERVELASCDQLVLASDSDTLARL